MREGARRKRRPARYIAPPVQRAVRLIRHIVEGNAVVKAVAQELDDDGAVTYLGIACEVDRSHPGQCERKKKQRIGSQLFARMEKSRPIALRPQKCEAEYPDDDARDVGQHIGRVLQAEERAAVREAVVSLVLVHRFDHLRTLLRLNHSRIR